MGVDEAAGGRSWEEPPTTDNGVAAADFADGATPYLYVIIPEELVLPFTNTIPSEARTVAAVCGAASER